MSYEPTNWKSGDTVTSAKLNKIEQGIANAGGGGGALVVQAVDGTLDHTWQEIHDAMPMVWMIGPTGEYAPAISADRNGEEYGVLIVVFGSEQYIKVKFITDSADGYPVFQQG